MKTLLLTAIWTLILSPVAIADDWTRFRGPNGSGVVEDANVPLEWSSERNLKWKSPLPGKGTSSPVVAGDRVYVTAYSGYGIDAENPGSPKDLERHVIALDRNSGEEVWRASVKSTADEDPYKGFITQHGYASSSVATDSKNVYAVLGKSGLFAYDQKGEQLWHVDLGQMSDPAKWGDGSSPIVVGDVVVVDAGILGHQLLGIDKNTGNKLWVLEGEGYTNSWSTPIVVEADGETQVLFSVPGQVIAVDPKNGKELWSARSPLKDSVCGSIVLSDDRAFLMGGREGHAIGIQCGGSGDVSDSNTVWQTRLRSSIATPVIVGDALYWASGGVFYSAGLGDGEYIYKERLPRTASGSSGFGNADYASPIAVGDKVIQFSRNGESYIIAAGGEFNLVTHNPSFDGDDSDFSATPAVVNGQMFVRSDKFLYCIGE